ncbi:MAG: TonB-dependent receptor [Phenylobacterium sp.]|uniref:TonB-dependent receptor n=1 Tax=Phenylobacterium sp. TaxID=1871053 RepID=UPI002736D923|nr:TonB-dependent receptor [Phenylobacterium sp.]MDP3750004.1 TonB-dependent receptor [Phenylobacterium sp.]
MPLGSFRAQLCAASAAAAMSAVLPGVARAQGATPVEAFGVEEVVVTARKRDETDISVPAVITAITAEQLARKGVGDIYAIAQMTPGLIINDNLSAIGGGISLRGVASGNTVGIDQTVSINLDGAAVSSAGATRIGQFDLRQVEVLKGPQTLFFGKNSPGGVISFISEGPTRDWDGYARGSYEFEADEWRTEGAISGPITEALSFRLAGYVTHIDGYLRNPLPSNWAPGVAGPSYSRAPNADEYGGRISLRFEPNDKLSANFKTAYFKVDGISNYGSSQLIYCPTGTAQAPQAIFGPPIDNCTMDRLTAGISDAPPSVTATRPRFGDGKPREERSVLVSTLNIDYDVTPELTLTSLTSYFNYQLHGFSTQVGPRVGIALSSDQDKRDYAQEVRLASSYGGAFDFMVGAYFQKSAFDEEPQLYLLTAPFNETNTFQEGHTNSAFGQLLWRITDEWELAGGARYTKEAKKVRLWKRGQGDVTSRLSRTRVEADDLSPEITLTYRPSTALTVFAAYKEGFKSGGFNPSVTTAAPVGYDPSFEPERARGGEVGVKSRLFGGSLRLDASLFDYKYEDLQVSAYDGVQLTVIIKNAASATVRGAEMNFKFQPPAVRGLTVDGGVAYTRARYDEFIGACYAGQTVAQGCNLIPSGGRFTSRDLSGLQLPNAPDWSSNVSAAYAFTVREGLSLELNGGIRHQSSNNPAGDLAPGGRQKAVTFLDLGARLFAEDRAWELALIGRNITDEIRAIGVTGQSVSGTTAGFATGTPADLVGFINRPIEVRLQLTVRPALWR